MIEMLVAMVLFGIVSGMAMYAAVDTLGNQAKVSASRKALGDANIAAQRFAEDVRGALSPDRQDELIDDNDLSMLIDTVPRAQGGRHPSSPRNRDVLAATETSLSLWANVVSVPGQPTLQECVTWQLLPSGSLVRTVRAFSAAGCNGAVLLQDTMLEPTPAAAVNARGDAVQLFQFTTLGRPGGTACASRQTTRVASNAELNRIVEINIDLRSLVGSGATVGRSTVKSSIGLRNRTTSQYLEGLGCLGSSVGFSGEAPTPAPDYWTPRPDEVEV